MDQGEAIFEGVPKTVVAQYQRLINLTGEAAQTVRAEIQSMDGSLSKDALTPVQNVPSEELPETVSGVSSAMDPSWFDEGLISQSTISYESKGALLEDPRLLNMDNVQVNHLASGRRYALEYKVSFAQDTQNFIVGMMVRTVSGVNLGGANNRRIELGNRHLITHAMAGETLNIRFEFNCIFRPDTYFITSGIMSEGEVDFLHRHEDMLAFKVMIGTDVSEGDAGIVALQSQLSMSR